MSDGINVNVIFGDGSSRNATISPAAVNLAKRFARTMPSLFEGTGFNPMNADCDRIVAVTRADHDLIHQIPRAEKEAIFRLGQMDMQQHIRQMLLDVADALEGGVARATLLSAVNMMETMTIDDGGSI